MMTDLEAELRKPFYSPTEVAEIANISASTVLNYIHSGKLTAVRLSERTYRIPRKAVLRLLDPEAVRVTTRETRPDEEVDLAEADRDAELFAGA